MSTSKGDSMSIPGEESNYMTLALEQAMMKLKAMSEAGTPPQEVLMAQFENFTAAFMTILAMMKVLNLPFIVEVKNLALNSLGTSAAVFGEPYSHEELSEAIRKLDEKGQLKEALIKDSEKFP
jgi:hypothetical protein